MRVDTLAPNVSAPVSPINNGNYSGNLVVNVSINDVTTSVSNVFFNLTNSSGQQNATFTASNPTGNYWNATITTSNFADGIYNLTVYANDSAGNLNKTTVVSNIRFDNTVPVVTLIDPADAVSATTSAYNFTFNVTEGNYISSCSLVMGGAYIQTLSSVNFTGGTNGMYNSSLSSSTWSVNCTDAAGNVANSSSRTFTVTAATTTTTSSGGGGGETGFWKSTFAYDSQDFSQRQPLTREYLKGYRARVKLGSDIHYMGVISLTATSATINVSSTSQQATLSIGESKKFEISGDGFYDTLVKLEGIKNNKANMTLSYIHEQVPQTPVNDTATTPPPANNAGETTPPPAGETGTKSRAWIWITALIIVLVIIAAVIIAYYSYFKKQGYKYHHNAHSFYA